MHDVDCVAAVLVLRAGRPATDLEQAREIFSTTTGLVVKNVNGWYRDEGQTGVPPTIFQASLSSRAWLKKPAAVSDVKLHELIALCAAVLRPNLQVWSAMLRHRRRMKEDGEITSDEEVAIVANEFTDVALSEVTADAEPDAASIAEVIERVQARYGRDADARVAKAEALAEERISTAERMKAEAAEAAATTARSVDDRWQRAETRVDAFAGRIAAVLSWLLFISLTVGLICGTRFAVGGFWGSVATAIVTLLTLGGSLWGISAMQLRVKVEVVIRAWIKRRFLD